MSGHVLLLFLHTAGSICDFVRVFYMRDRGLETVLCRSDLLDCDNVFHTIRFTERTFFALKDSELS